MKRKEFIKQACGVGLCSCVIASMFAPAARLAAEEPKPEDKPEKPKEDWRIGFMQQRYAKLLTALSTRVEAPALSGALEEVGRYCAGTSNMAAPFAGNPEGLFAVMREKWHADVTYDAEQGAVALAFPEMKECPCAFVRAGVTPACVCQCSIGWQKHAFEVVFGRPVEVELKGSLLRGDRRCSFEIRAGA